MVDRWVKSFLLKMNNEIVLGRVQNSLGLLSGQSLGSIWTFLQNSKGFRHFDNFRGLSGTLGFDFWVRV